MKPNSSISYHILILIFLLRGCNNVFAQKVYISEIFYDTPLYEDSWGNDEHHNGEFIELYNPGTQATNISGWIIKDRNSKDMIIIPEGFVIKPKSFFLIVFGNSNFNISQLFHSLSKSKSIYYHNILKLTNKRNGVYLYDQKECIIDSMMYPSLPNENKLYARNPENTTIVDASKCMSLHRRDIKRDFQGNGTFTQGQWTYSKVSPYFSEYLADSNYTDDSGSIRNGKLGEIANVEKDNLPGEKSQNYITTRNYLSADGTKYIDNIEYFDGLGRPFQQVAKGVTPTKSNLVTLQGYDGLGRLDKKWLAVPSTSDFYSFRDTSQIKDYYNDIRPFVETVYEASPLNRIKGETQIGATCWNEHSIGTDYLTNNAKEPFLRCKYFDVVNDELIDKGYYSDGELYVTKTTDVVGNESYLFKDKLDRQVLIRQIGLSILNARDNHDTYFVYDDFGNLRYVLPPMMNESIDELELYGYQYFYDTRNRCIEKVLPGGVRYSYIYDKADRLRFIQDGNQREKGEWKFIKYDGLGREIQTGIFSTGLSFSDLEKNLNNNPLTEVVEPNNPAWYTNQSYPKITTTATIYSANYYDNYGYINTLSNIHQANSELNKLYCDSEWDSAKGVVTCKKVYVEKDANYIFTKYRYDYRGHPIQIIETRENGGYLNEYYKYSFSGNILQKRSENNLYGYKEPDVTETYRYSYDHADRLDTTFYSFKVPNREEQSFVMSLNVYNELGQLEEKKLHRENTNFLNSIYYKYNILGQITEIENNLELLNYSYQEDKDFKNNVTSVSYKYKGEYENSYYNNSKYFYKYDNLDRLVLSTLIKSNGSKDIFESIDYDKNGNINSKFNSHSSIMGEQGLSYEYIGNRVSKITNSEGPNMWYRSQYFQDQVDEEIEYLYDNVGNLVIDKNKGISLIKYNALNLPVLIQMKDGGQIKYKYDAEGKKHEQVDIFLSQNIICPFGTSLNLDETQIRARNSTTYLGNVIYKNDSVFRINTTEGHIEKQGDSYDIFYHLKDNLGNVRAEVGLDNRIHNKTDYYPFGMEWDKSSYISFAYNGKEKIETHGFNMYDYGARFYDQTIQRWHSMDPLAEKYYSISPYAYCANNPMKYIDPDGREIIIGTFLERLLSLLGFENFVSKTKENLEQLKQLSPELNNSITSMENSKLKIYIEKTDSENGMTYRAYEQEGIKQGSIISYDADDKSGEYSSLETIAHELGHAEQNMKGTYIKYDKSKASSNSDKQNEVERNKGNKSEKKSIRYQNYVRKYQNENPRDFEYYKKSK